MNYHVKISIIEYNILFYGCLVLIHTQLITLIIPKPLQIITFLINSSANNISHNRNYEAFNTQAKNFSLWFAVS